MYAIDRTEQQLLVHLPLRYLTGKDAHFILAKEGTLERALAKIYPKAYKTKAMERWTTFINSVNPDARIYLSLLRDIIAGAVVSRAKQVTISSKFAIQMGNLDKMDIPKKRATVPAYEKVKELLGPKEQVSVVLWGDVEVIVKIKHDKGGMRLRTKALIPRNQS